MLASNPANHPPWRPFYHSFLMTRSLLTMIFLPPSRQLVNGVNFHCAFAGLPLPLRASCCMDRFEQRDFAPLSHAVHPYRLELHS